MGLSPWLRPLRRPQVRYGSPERRSSGTRIILGLGLLSAIWAPTIVLGDTAHLAADIGIDVILTAVALTLARRHGMMRSRPGGTRRG
jgi:hypothetical protein